MYNNQMSANLSTTIKVNLPDNQGWTAGNAKVNFKVDYNSLIRNLPIYARLKPSDPIFKVETVYIIFNKEKHELTEDFHAEFVKKYLTLFKKENTHVALQVSNIY